MQAQAKPSRLLALDVLRGITIAGMITVNNPGSWSYVYAPLRHATWDGLTPTDLVFPFFIFIMGVSMYMSYQKFDFKFSNQTFFKLIRRAGLLFLIGLCLSYFGLFCRGLAALRVEELPLFEKITQAGFHNLENLRIMGVLQRLALVSLFGSLSMLLIKPKYIPWFAGGILLLYWILMVTTNSLLCTETNLIARIDVALMGSSHLYKLTPPDGMQIPFDPEGILSTLPCIAHVLVGVMAGRFIHLAATNEIRIQKLAIFGTIILFLGCLIDYSFPINKTVWSTSYVLVCCGLSSLFLGLLIWIIDIRGQKKWARFFETFGINPMAIFVLAGVVAVLTNTIGFTYQADYYSISGFIYRMVLSPLLGNYLGSLAYALFFITICWGIGYALQKNRIYIKL